MADQGVADSAALVGLIDGKLAEQQARQGVGRLSRADLARERAGFDSGRCKTIVADNATFLMDHDDHRETPLLVGEGALP